jgi:acyl phosphate:glycerol-3-phosphate acyltransferase
MTDMDWLPTVLILAGYVVGSIPFGIVVSKCLGTADPRTAGSRNIGFTNVLRVGGKAPGLLTLAGDVGKGWVMAWLAMHLTDRPWALLVAFSVILGHLFSLFLRYRGGKGVATAFGAVLGLEPAVGLMLVFVWVAGLLLTGYSSGAAIGSFVLFPILAGIWTHDSVFFLFAFVVSVLILLRHKDNIIRLWKGTEPRMGRRSVQDGCER